MRRPIVLGRSQRPGTVTNQGLPSGGLLHFSVISLSSVTNMRAAVTVFKRPGRPEPDVLKQDGLRSQVPTPKPRRYAGLPAGHARPSGRLSGISTANVIPM